MISMKIIVPDASVILKWVLKDDEMHREKALAILSGWLGRKYEIIVPSLWCYEVGNILTRRAPVYAGAIMEKLLQYEFPEIKITTPLLSLMIELTQKKKVTFYDAAYHAIAIMEKGKFVTFDKEYYNRTKDIGYIQLLDSSL